MNLIDLLLKNQLPQKMADILTPGINPAAPDYRTQIPTQPAQTQTAATGSQGVFGKVDEFLNRPGGSMLMNLLAQEGYSTMPSSPFGAIGRAYGATQQQDLQRKLIENRLNAYQRGGMDPAGLREFEGMTAGLSDDDRESARRIALGLDPRAGISATERIVADPLLSELIAKYEGRLTEAKEGSKSDVQRESSVRATNADRKQTLAVWEAARGPLISALEGTITGPVIGLSPALTAPQQICLLYTSPSPRD